MTQEKKLILIVVIAVIATALITGSLVYWLQGQKIDKVTRGLWVNQHHMEDEIDELKEQVDIEKVKGEEEPVVEDITEMIGEDEQIYVNKEHGYKISYPSNMILDDTHKESGVIQFLTKERKEKLETEAMIRVYDVRIQYWSLASDIPGNTDNRQLFEWLALQNKQGSFEYGKTTKVDGVFAWDGIESGHGESYALYFSNSINRDKNCYRISTGDTASPTAIEKQIINSFEFLD